MPLPVQCIGNAWGYNFDTVISIFHLIHLIKLLHYSSNKQQIVMSMDSFIKVVFCAIFIAKVGL